MVVVKTTTSELVGVKYATFPLAPVAVTIAGVGVTYGTVSVSVCVLPAIVTVAVLKTIGILALGAPVNRVCVWLVEIVVSPPGQTST